MYRIDHSTRAIDKNGSGKDGFEDRDTSAGIAGTVVTAEWIGDAWQNVAQFLRASGIEPDLSDYDQLIGAFDMPAHFFQIHTGTANRFNRVRSLNGWVFLLGNSGTLQYSREGNTWTGVSLSGGFADQCWDLAYSPTLDQYVFVGVSGEIQTSPAGSNGEPTTWTARTPGSSFSGALFCAQWDAVNDVYVIAGASEEIQTSTDGQTWTRRNTGGSESMTDIAVSPSGISVISGTNSALYESSNGTTWTARSLSTAGNPYLKNVNWQNSLNRFVVSGGFPGSGLGADAAIETSTDGQTWTNVYEEIPCVTGIGSMRIWGRSLYIYGLNNYASNDEAIWYNRNLPATPTEAKQNLAILNNITTLTVGSLEIRSICIHNDVVFVGMESGILFRSIRAVT